MKLNWSVTLGLFLMAVCGGCGGGGGASSSSSSGGSTPQGTNNVQPIEVDLGPTGNYRNGLFTSVTICVPGTSTCQTIDNVLVDTGSSGLRILSSELSVSLPAQTAEDGSPVGECAQFVDFFTWGPVEKADVKVAGETAESVPLQIIGSSKFASPPPDCTDTGLPSADTLAALGAKGILGVGLFAQDCGSACTSGVGNPRNYFACPASGCTVTTEGLADQVQNPVPLFSSDNNGVLISLPAIGAGGAATVSGSMTFGIGTRANNGLGSAQVYTTDDLGNFTTVYNSNSYDTSFIDSGSNAIFFLSSGVTGIPECSSDPAFYCPANTLALSAENVGANDASGTVSFNIANANQLFSTSNAAFNDLGGTNPGTFDWGMPFFFGRNIFVAIEGQNTPAGPGPYWAY